MKGSTHKICLLSSLFVGAFALDLFGSPYALSVGFTGVVYALFLKLKYNRVLEGGTK